MLNRNAINSVVLTAALLASARVLAAPPMPETEATITSDQVELIDNGQKTIFSGHVVLEKAPYKLKARRMTRYKDSETIQADGRIVGMWKHPKGGKTEVYSDHARYDPKSQTAELWTDPGKRIIVESESPKGSGRFLSDRAQVDVVAKTVRMIDRVIGRITPAPAP